MKRPIGMLAIALAVLMASAGARAQSESESGARPWLHVRVSEKGDAAASVNVNLPLSAVEAVVALLPDRIMFRGRMRLHRDHELSVSDLRTLWDAVRDTEDSEFVSIDHDDGQVRVARSGDVIQIRIDGRDDDDDDVKSVRVEIPVDVVDALLSGDGDTLNLVGALERLKERRGDLVRITDGDERVHIWIDEEQG